MEKLAFGELVNAAKAEDIDTQIIPNAHSPVRDDMGAYYSFATSVTFRVDKRLISNKLFEHLPKKGISKNFIVVAKIRKKHLYMKLERFFSKNNEVPRITSPHPSLS